MIKKLLVLALGLIFLAPFAAVAAPAPYKAVYGHGPEKFTLATGSPGELGLLKALTEGFDKSMQGKIIDNLAVLKNLKFHTCPCLSIYDYYDAGPDDPRQ